MSLGAGPKTPLGFSNSKRVDLEAAWKQREYEAGILRASGSVETRAMEISLRLYALEVRLKALICQHLDLDYLPKACMVHNLDFLLMLSGRHRELEDPARGRVKLMWNALSDFSHNRLNDVRYLPDRMSDSEYRRLGTAFDDPDRGVLAWLSERP